MSQRPRNAGYEQSRGAAGRGAGKTGAAAGGRYGHQQAGAPQQPHAYPQQPQPQQQAQGHKGAPPPPGYGRTSPYSSPAPFSPSQTPQHVYPTPHHPELLPVPFFSLSPQELYRRLSDPKNPIPSYVNLSLSFFSFFCFLKN
ncbi:MAG: hypothetical protein Q8P67_12600 [archaeon]|nr:hypothetical protein [archaeon]